MPRVQDNAIAGLLQGFGEGRVNRGRESAFFKDKARGKADEGPRG